MKKKRLFPQKGITGIILANQWDENGNVIGVSIYTGREEIYIVAHNRRIKEMVDLVQTKARVEGKIKERINGEKYIYVATVRTIEYDFEDLKESPSKTGILNLIGSRSDDHHRSSDR